MVHIERLPFSWGSVFNGKLGIDEKEIEEIEEADEDMPTDSSEERKKEEISGMRDPEHVNFSKIFKKDNEKNLF